MTEDAINTLYNKVFDTYYDCHFEEIIADKLVYRWQFFDQMSKLLVALTTSGSAVAGWALWSQPGLRPIWAVLAGSAGVLSIVHAVLAVSSTLKE